MSSHHPVARRTSIVLGLVLVIVILAVGMVYALLTQTVPSATVPQATVSSSCGGLSTASTVTATSGAIQYTCSGGPAFDTVTGTSSYSLTGYTSCPSVVTMPCYSNLGYVAHGDTTTCVNGATLGTSFHPISGSANPLTFTAGSWDYCAFYAAPSIGGPLPGFTIAWTP